MLLLVNNEHKNDITESQNRQNFRSMRTLFVICSRFSQSEARIFFMYIINKVLRD